MEWPSGHAGIWSIYLICLTFPPPHCVIWLHGLISHQRHVSFLSMQVEEVEHPLHVSVVPVMLAQWWSSELSAKFWYEGVGSPRQKSVVFLERSSPAFSSSLAKVVRCYFRKKPRLFIIEHGWQNWGLRGSARSLPGWLYGFVTYVLEDLRDDDIVLTGRCLGKEVHLINISWWKAWFKNASLLSAALCLYLIYFIKI